jgi:serine phosphatase RsbU (regulator of sigma subunit)
VLYTDGVGDVPPPHGLDEEEVHRLFAEAAGRATAGSLEVVADGIQERLDTVLALDERDDDMALLLLRVPPVAS